MQHVYLGTAKKLSSIKYSSDIIIEGESKVGAVTLRAKVLKGFKVKKIIPNASVKKEFDYNLNYKVEGSQIILSIAWASLNSIPEGKHVFATLEYTIDRATLNPIKILVDDSELANEKAQVLKTKFYVES